MKFITILAVKREDSFYHFKHSPFEEVLCNGTEKVIDTHYFFLTGKEPIPGNKIQIHLSTEEPVSEDDYDTVLTFQWADRNGSTYLDDVMCDNVYFSNWLQDYFGNLSNYLYVQFDIAK